MSSLWSSRRDVSPETSRLMIERAYEELVSGNDVDPRLRDVRQLVRDSWRRSLDNLVGVEALPPLDFSEELLEKYRRAHPLAEAMDMVRGLLLPGGAKESGVIVAVGDEAGRLLWVEGDHRIRTLTGDMGFTEGANWSEDAVGTSAPGTALQLDRSVQILGAEHFNRLVQPWSCTAAPVHDPETRRIIGVIDVTGDASAITPQTQLLVDATARAIEGELLVSRLRARVERPLKTKKRHPATSRFTLRVLGRDRGVLEAASDQSSISVPVGSRHAEILLMLATHRQGLSAERLAELVYDDSEAVVTLRAEMVRMRRMLQQHAPALVPESRPYRLPVHLETDAQQLLSLLDRGAHRVALAAYRGDVLPDSTSSGVEEVRSTVRMALREAIMAEASVEVLLSFLDTDLGADDIEALRLCLRVLPTRSPKRAGIVARVEALGSDT